MKKIKSVLKKLGNAYMRGIAEVYGPIYYRP